MFLHPHPELIQTIGADVHVIIQKHHIGTLDFSAMRHAIVALVRWASLFIPVGEASVSSKLAEELLMLSDGCGGHEDDMEAHALAGEDALEATLKERVSLMVTNYDGDFRSCWRRLLHHA